MALSPWPTTPPALAAAVTRLKAAAQGATLDSDTRAAELGAVAAELVQQYAPRAPQALRDEAVIRFAGYLAQSDFGSIAKDAIGPLNREYPTNHAAMFRNCGAAALLTRWRVRRAGVVG